MFSRNKMREDQVFALKFIADPEVVYLVISRHISGAQLEGDLGVATPILFVVNLTRALLVTAFCIHFPKPRRSTSFEMIKIALRCLDTTNQPLPFEFPSCAPCNFHPLKISHVHNWHFQNFTSLTLSQPCQTLFCSS